MKFFAVVLILTILRKDLLVVQGYSLNGGGVQRSDSGVIGNQLDGE